MPKMHKLPYELGLPVGSRSKLGLIVLQADETIEFEFWQLISGLDLALHVSRISSSSKVSEDTLMAMKKELTKAASLFPEKLKFDIVGYACTSASSVIGSETVSKMIKKGCNTGEVCNPISSLIDACNYMKINDILFLSPYVSDVSNRLIEHEFSCVCFSSNQVLIWNMLRLAKIDCDVTGYGKLLSKISKE